MSLLELVDRLIKGLTGSAKSAPSILHNAFHTPSHTPSILLSYAFLPSIRLPYTFHIKKKLMIFGRENLALFDP